MTVDITALDIKDSINEMATEWTKKLIKHVLGFADYCKTLKEMKNLRSCIR